MLTRLHFDTDINIGKTIKKMIRVKIELVYLGQNIYNVKAINLSTSNMKDSKEQDVIHNKRHEYPMVRGNGRKSFVKLRDFALNAVEGLDYTTERVV